MARYVIGGLTLEYPDDMSPAMVLSAMRQSPAVMRAIDAETLLSFGSDAAREIMPSQHYWRVRKNRKATKAETLWADEYKRRFGEPADENALARASMTRADSVKGKRTPIKSGVEQRIELGRKMRAGMDPMTAIMTALDMPRQATWAALAPAMRRGQFALSQSEQKHMGELANRSFWDRMAYVAATPQSYMLDPARASEVEQQAAREPWYGPSHWALARSTVADMLADPTTYLPGGLGVLSNLVQNAKLSRGLMTAGRVGLANLAGQAAGGAFTQAMRGNYIEALVSGAMATLAGLGAAHTRPIVEVSRSGKPEVSLDTVFGVKTLPLPEPPPTIFKPTHEIRGTPVINIGGRWYEVNIDGTRGKLVVRRRNAASPFVEKPVTPPPTVDSTAEPPVVPATAGVLPSGVERTSPPAVPVVPDRPPTVDTPGTAPKVEPALKPLSPSELLGAQKPEPVAAPKPLSPSELLGAQKPEPVAAPEPAPRPKSATRPATRTEPAPTQVAPPEPAAEPVAVQAPTRTVEVVKLGPRETPPEGVVSGMRARYNLNTAPKSEYGKPKSGWLGNPHRWEGNGGTGTVEDAIERYRQDFQAKVDADPEFAEAVRNLARDGKKLGYYRPEGEGQSGKHHLQVVQDWIDADASRRQGGGDAKQVQGTAPVPEAARAPEVAKPAAPTKPLKTQSATQSVTDASYAQDAMLTPDEYRAKHEARIRGEEAKVVEDQLREMEASGRRVSGFDPGAERDKAARRADVQLQQIIGQSMAVKDAYDAGTPVSVEAATFHNRPPPDNYVQVGNHYVRRGSTSQPAQVPQEGVTNAVQERSTATVGAQPVRRPRVGQGQGGGVRPQEQGARPTRAQEAPVVQAAPAVAAPVARRRKPKPPWRLTVEQASQFYRTPEGGESRSAARKRSDAVSSLVRAIESGNEDRMKLAWAEYKHAVGEWTPDQFHRFMAEALPQKQAPTATPEPEATVDSRTLDERKREARAARKQMDATSARHQNARTALVEAQTALADAEADIAISPKHKTYREKHARAVDAYDRASKEYEAAAEEYSRQRSQLRELEAAAGIKRKSGDEPGVMHSIEVPRQVWSSVGHLGGTRKSARKDRIRLSKRFANGTRLLVIPDELMDWYSKNSAGVYMDTEKGVASFLSRMRENSGQDSEVDRRIREIETLLDPDGSAGYGGKLAAVRRSVAGLPTLEMQGGGTIRHEIVGHSAFRAVDPLIWLPPEHRRAVTKMLSYYGDDIWSLAAELVSTRYPDSGAKRWMDAIQEGYPGSGGMRLEEMIVNVVMRKSRHPSTPNGPAVAEARILQSIIEATTTVLRDEARYPGLRPDLDVRDPKSVASEVVRMLTTIYDEAMKRDTTQLARRPAVVGAVRRLHERAGSVQGEGGAGGSGRISEAKVQTADAPAAMVDVDVPRETWQSVGHLGGNRPSGQGRTRGPRLSKPFANGVRLLVVSDEMMGLLDPSADGLYTRSGIGVHWTFKTAARDLRGTRNVALRKEMYQIRSLLRATDVLTNGKLAIVGRSQVGRRSLRMHGADVVRHEVSGHPTWDAVFKPPSESTAARQLVDDVADDVWAGALSELEHLEDGQRALALMHRIEENYRDDGAPTFIEEAVIRTATGKGVRDAKDAQANADILRALMKSTENVLKLRMARGQLSGYQLDVTKPGSFARQLVDTLETIYESALEQRKVLEAEDTLFDYKVETGIAERDNPDDLPALMAERDADLQKMRESGIKVSSSGVVQPAPIPARTESVRQAVRKLQKGEPTRANTAEVDFEEPPINPPYAASRGGEEVARGGGDGPPAERRTGDTGDTGGLLQGTRRRFKLPPKRDFYPLGYGASSPLDRKIMVRDANGNWITHTRRGSFARMLTPEESEQVNSIAREYETRMSERVAESYDRLSRIDAILEQTARSTGAPIEQVHERFVDLVEKGFNDPERRVADPGVQRALELHDEQTRRQKEWLQEAHPEFQGITEKGYFLHSFPGRFAIYQIMPDGTRRHVGPTRDSWADTVSLAATLMEQNPGAQYVPAVFGNMRPGMLRVTDKRFYGMVGRMAQALSDSRGDIMSPAEFRAEVASTLRKAGKISTARSREKFLGSMLKRTGAEGYSRDYPTVMRLSATQTIRHLELTRLNKALVPIIEKLESEGRTAQATALRAWMDTQWGIPTQDEKIAGAIFRGLPLTRWWEAKYGVPTDDQWRYIVDALRTLTYNAKVRVNPGTAIANALQPFVTLGDIATPKEISSAIWRIYTDRNTRLLLRQKGVLQSGSKFIGGEAVVTPATSLGHMPMDFTSNANRGVGYLIGRERRLAANPEATEHELHMFGLMGAELAEFNNTILNAPPVMRTPIAQGLGQFRSFSMKSIEDMIASASRMGDERALPLTGGKVSKESMARFARKLVPLLLAGGAKAALPSSIALRLYGPAREQLERMGVDRKFAKPFVDALIYGMPALGDVDFSGRVSMADMFSYGGRTLMSQVGTVLTGPSISSAYNMSAAASAFVGYWTARSRGRRKDALRQAELTWQHLSRVTPLIRMLRAALDIRSGHRQTNIGNAKYTRKPHEMALQALGQQTLPVSKRFEKTGGALDERFVGDY